VGEAWLRKRGHAALQKQIARGSAQQDDWKWPALLTSGLATAPCRLLGHRALPDSH